MARSLADEGISVVIPAFNEEGAVQRQIEEVHAAIRHTRRPYEIIVVDDGSTDRTAERAATQEIRLIRRDRKYGYGSALKAGIAEAKFDWILILDADGTYPSAAIPQLLEHLPDADMVIGARTGKIVQSPLMRRGPKWVLRQYASYLAGQHIPDLNSGMRVMRKAVVERFLDLLPSGFSFTTTITLAMISNGYRVIYKPIDYFKRVGTSKIRPVDFFRIFALITRLMLLFRPMRLLVTAGSAVLLLAFLEYRYDLTPIDVSAARFASLSGFILALGGLVEYRSHHFRMPRTNIVRLPRPKFRERIASSRGLRVLGSMILLLSLTFFLPRDKILGALRVIHPAILAAAIPLLLAVHTLGSWKWHLLVNKGGAGLRFSSSVRLYFSGLFGNLFLPSIVGGDAVMVALGLRETRSRGAIVLGSLVNRVLDLGGLIAISFAGAVAQGGALDTQSRRWLETILIAAAVGVILVISAFVMHPDRLPRKLRALYLQHQPLIDALRRPGTYAAPFAMSVLMQLSLLLMTASIAETCGLHVAFGAWLLAWPLAKLVALLPVTVGGIGARELALAALLGPFGAPAASAIAVGLAWDGVLVGGSLFAGLISRVLSRIR
jgi:glycosyltransferase involved in cell wall biosynthesis/uncharacterized membrane protein YbhN (UPF0104 family)